MTDLNVFIKIILNFLNKKGIKKRKTEEGMRKWERNVVQHINHKEHHDFWYLIL